MAKKVRTYGEPEPYGFIERLRMHRIGLAPVFLALPVLIFGIVCNTALDGMLMAVCMVSVTLAAAVWVVTRVPEGWRRVHWAIIIAAIDTWLIWASTLSTARGWMWALGLLASGTILLAIPHWADQVKRTKVHMEGMIRNWPLHAERIGLGDTRIVNMTHTAVGWVGKLTWPQGKHSIRKIQKTEHEIEGALDLPHNSLKIEFDGKSNRSVILNVTLEDPHAKGIMWQPPVRPTADGPQVRTLHGADAFEIGVRADGTKKFLQIFKPGWGARSIMVGGTKGSGKSGFLNLIWTTMALCDDVVQWGIDLKGGAELGPWEGVFDWIVNDYESALRMVEAAEQLVERRGHLLKKYGWKSWQGSAEHPWVLISIDEAASLLGKMDSKQLFRVEEIARKGRAVGVALIVATQYPTLDAIGSTQIREQLDQAFCFRMKSDTGESFVITAGDVDAQLIDADRPGTCYHQDGEKLDRIAMRIIFVGDGSAGTRNTVKVIADMMRGETPEMDSDSIRDGIEKLEAYANREEVNGMRDSNRDERDGDTEMSEMDTETAAEFVEDDSATLGEIMSRAEMAKTPAERDADAAARAAEVEPETLKLSDEDARVALIDALSRAGSTGLSYGELEGPTTRKKTWVYDRLLELESDDRVRRTGDGKWAQTDALINAG